MNQIREWLKKAKKHKLFWVTTVFCILSLPVVVYSIGLLATGSKVSYGDADYLIQAQEAMRRTILEFHQFPWWNPWVSGGVPLFANPQFGLFSIVTPLTLLFGAALGYKIAILSYLLIGFWGMRTLLTRALRSPALTATLLSYIWTFGTFLAARIMLGHFTFLTIQFFPWALLFFIQRKSDKWSWLKFGFITALMALSAAHNTTIMAYLILGILFVFSCVKILISRKSHKLSASVTLLGTDLIFWLKSGAVFLALTSFRLLLTLQYIKDFPRPTVGDEQSLGILKGLFSVFGPLKQFSDTPSLPQIGWSWHEATTYIGLATLLAFGVVLFLMIKFRKNIKNSFGFSPSVILAVILLCFLLGLGGFLGKLSPYSLLHELPIFSSMRVAPRWFAWSALFVLVFIGNYKGSKYRTGLNILLSISVVELFFFSMPNISKPYTISLPQKQTESTIFKQKKHYNTQRNRVFYDDNFTGATIENYGQIIAGDALVDTRFAPPVGITTKRCSIDEGCEFVLSRNALVNYWSPNKIHLTRTDNNNAPVRINMNPGSCWAANGAYINPAEKETNPAAEFIVQSEEKSISLECIPKFSPAWWVNKLF